MIQFRKKVAKKKKNQKKTEKKSETENSTNEDYVEEVHTYIYYKLKFNESINPKIPGFDDQADSSELLH